MHDVFVGTWKLSPARSQFDLNHRPTEGTLTWRLEQDGSYLMLAQGTNEKGQRVTERPQRLVPDGQPYPVPDFPGLSCVTTRPAPDSLRAQVRREDGSIAGEGTYTIERDGRSMTAVTAGFDTQFRRFEMRTVWEKAATANAEP